MVLSRSDAEVGRDVSDALVSDIRVDAQSLDVEVVRGVVYLRGSVPSYYEKRIATEIADRIKGVEGIVNELRVKPVTPRGDSEIESDVRAALTRNNWVDETTISVYVAEGVVYLSGTVDSYAERSYAESDAWSVPAVIDVVDGILIRPTPVRPDAEIAAQVRSDLEQNIRLDPARLDVEVERGIVRLRGEVGTVEQKWLADEVAWWTAGVRDVVNDLRVAA